MVVGEPEEATEAANALVSKFRFLFDLYGWVTKKKLGHSKFLNICIKLSRYSQNKIDLYNHC
jgi:hypothetical protein